jgi:hypothetical protein
MRSVIAHSVGGVAAVAFGLAVGLALACPLVILLRILGP